MVTILFFIKSFVCVAAIGPMPPPPGPPPPPGLPIDSYLFYGFIIALLLGIKKIIEFNKE